MTKPKDPKVINLDKERLKRDAKAGEKAHRDGRAFKLAPYAFEDEGIGFNADEELPIVVITNAAGLEGLAMKPEDAALLAKALTKCVASCRKAQKAGA